MTIVDAVVPVGGLGTRLLPATKSQPKEMLPVVRKPVAQYVVEELAQAGVERVLFVTGRRKRALEDHFDADPELERAVGGAGAALDTRSGVEVFYTRQARPRGLGDALLCAQGFASGRPVVVALGDAIVSGLGSGGGLVARLVEAFEAGDADAAVAVEEVSDAAVSRYGVVAVDGEVVTDVVEKPSVEEAPSRLAVAARYVLGPAVFAALGEVQPDAGGEIQVADALRAVVRGGG